MRLSLALLRGVSLVLHHGERDYDHGGGEAIQCVSASMGAGEPAAWAHFTVLFKISDVETEPDTQSYDAATRSTRLFFPSAFCTSFTQYSARGGGRAPGQAPTCHRGLLHVPPREHLSRVGRRNLLSRKSSVTITLVQGDDHDALSNVLSGDHTIALWCDKAIRRQGGLDLEQGSLMRAVS